MSVYLEEPEYGEEDRDDERHRQIRERMTTDDRADRLEEGCQSSLAGRAVEYHSPDLQINNRRTDSRTLHRQLIDIALFLYIGCDIKHIILIFVLAISNKILFLT